MNRPFKFFTGRASRKIAEAIASEYNVELGDQNIIEFSDGEFEPSFTESIRGADIFIIQSTMPPGDNLLELLLMIDAARRASAYKINAVIPYFGYARQDKKGKPRVPIGAKLIANLLTTAGADRVLTMDLHADQIQGFFDIPVDNIYATPLFLADIHKQNYQDTIIVSPDVGGVVRARALAKQLNSDLAIVDKRRPEANVSEVMQIIGDVKD